MSDNKLTCKPSDNEAANKCSSSHFENPSEVSIRPHAPNRKRSSDGSKKEKVDHDSQHKKTASKPMTPESQPPTQKENSTERSNEKGQSSPVSSSAQYDDNADKASQKMDMYFTEGEEGEKVEETGQSTPASSGEEKGHKPDETGQSNPIPSGGEQDQAQKADETGQSIPPLSGEAKGPDADETGQSNPPAGQDTSQSNAPVFGEDTVSKTEETGPSNPPPSGEENGVKADETGQLIPNSSGNEHGKEAEKPEFNPISDGENQGQKDDGTGQSFPASSEEEYGEDEDETEMSFPASTEEEYAGNEDETGQPFPLYFGEEYGEGANETSRPLPDYYGEEYGEGAGEVREAGEPNDRLYGNNEPPDLYNPLVGQEAPDTSQGAPGGTKNIFDLRPYTLPAWAEEFKATRCGKSNDYAYRNPSFYRRYYSTRVYFSRCCESGSYYNANNNFNGSSYCNELLRKYREQNVSFAKEGPSEGKKESAPTPTPNPSKTNAAATKSNAIIKKEDEEPGCCKCCCCCECCCKWYSWIIWLILLINAMALAYVIWWEGCGLAVLVFDDMTDWSRYNLVKWVKDILGLEYTMQLFLSFLGYCAYFWVVCCCYIYCKKCTIPDDQRSFCTCKEIKLIIHIVYGAVMIVLLYMELVEWKIKRNKFKGKELVKKDKEHECLQICLWFTFAILIVGVTVFVLYSVERRQIRKRIHPEKAITQNEQNGGYMSNRPYSAVSNGPSRPGNDAIPAAMIIRNVCGETVAPMFQRPMMMRRVESFTDCGFSHEVYHASTVCTD